MRAAEGGRPGRLFRWTATLLIATTAVAAPVGAQDQPDDDTRQRVQLVEAPSGCVLPDLPDVVFVGRVVATDFRTARFEIAQVRAGDAAPFAFDDLIDVRYGLDVQFVEPGSEYLVSARRDPVIGVLYSRVTEPTPDFGGDEIAGLAEPDLDCPGSEDPIRTLNPDGSEVSTSLLAPLFESRRRLLVAIVVPIGIAFGLVFVLAMLRLGVAGVIRGVRSAVSPARPVRRGPQGLPGQG